MPPTDPDRFLAIKVVMMPRDTNPMGTIFGGVLLSFIDQAGAIGARRAMSDSGWPENPVVTVGMNSVEFHQPVYVGDVVSFWTNLVRVGRTSVTIHVTVEAERDHAVIKLTEADVTFVAVDMSVIPPRPVPIRGLDE